MIQQLPLDHDRLPSELVYLSLTAAGMAGLLASAVLSLGSLAFVLCLLWIGLAYDRARHRSRRRGEHQLSNRFWRGRPTGVTKRGRRTEVAEPRFKRGRVAPTAA